MVVAVCICTKSSNAPANAPCSQMPEMPDGYAKFELLLQALESALEFVKALEEGCYVPETSQGKIILALCEQIGDHITLPGYNSDSS